MLLIGSIAGAAARTIDETKFLPADIIVRDVAVIGGGASGAYAAVRIKDSGKTVVVVDQSDRLVSRRPPRRDVARPRSSPAARRAATSTRTPTSRRGSRSTTASRPT